MFSFLKKKKEEVSNNEMIYAPVKGKAVASKEVSDPTFGEEILGAGMVNPKVLENCGIDSKVYSGYAIGIGVERTAMNIFEINDLRAFFENDSRFLKQIR